MTFNIKPRKPRRLRARLVLLAACLLALCFESAGSQLSATDLQAMVERLASDKQMCAMSYATIKAGKLSSSGAANDCDHSRVPTEDSVFQAASLSKPAFAYAVLKLA